MHKLSLCHYTLFDVSPPRLVEIAAATGFQSISLMLQFPRGDARGYPMLGATPMRRETKSRLADSGITLFDVSTCRLDETVELESFRPMFESADYLGARHVSVSIFDTDENRRADRFAKSCEILGEFGLGAALEFMPLSAIKTLGDAECLIQTTKVSNATITVDAAHFNRSGSTLAHLRTIDPTRIAYVQLCDGPVYLPPEQWAWEAGEERQLPGDGDFLLRELINVLPADILVGIEAPSKRRTLQGVSPEAYARQAHQALQRLLSEFEAK